MHNAVGVFGASPATERITSGIAGAADTHTNPGEREERRYVVVRCMVYAVRIDVMRKNTHLWNNLI